MCYQLELEKTNKNKMEIHLYEKEKGKEDKRNGTVKTVKPPRKPR